MKAIADWALDVANHLGASYADVRLADDRHRGLSTKNGKVGSASVAESFGFGVRVIADGAWGFAASDDLGRAAVEATAARAVEIAKASSRVKLHDIQLAPEKAMTAEWTSPFQIDPFTTSVEQNIELLLKIDSELRSVPGVTLAETNLNFRREEQWFFSSEGADIHQTKYTTGTGYAALRICRKRNPEALVSQFLWRAVAEQRIRTGGRTEAGGKRAPRGRRSSRPADR